MRSLATRVNTTDAGRVSATMLPAFLMAFALHLVLFWALLERESDGAGLAGPSAIRVDIAPSAVETALALPDASPDPEKAGERDTGETVPAAEPSAALPPPEANPAEASLAPPEARRVLAPDVSATVAIDSELSAPPPPAAPPEVATAPAPPGETIIAGSDAAVTPLSPPSSVAPSAQPRLPAASRTPPPPRRLPNARRPSTTSPSQVEPSQPARSVPSVPASPPSTAPDLSVVASFHQQVAAALRNRLRFPRDAEARGARGVTTVKFTMQRDGVVIAATVMSPSGDAALDAAALTAAAPGARLPPAPDSLKQTTFTFLVPLRFLGR